MEEVLIIFVSCFLGVDLCERCDVFVFCFVVEDLLLEISNVYKKI